MIGALNKEISVILLLFSILVETAMINNCLLLFSIMAFKPMSEPSQAELFDQKFEPKLELSKPSLGSGATLVQSVTKNMAPLKRRCKNDWSLEQRNICHLDVVLYTGRNCYDQ